MQAAYVPEGAGLSHRPEEAEPQGAQEAARPDHPSEGVRSAFFPKTDSSRFRLHWLKLIHCTNSYIFFKEKNDINHHGFLKDPFAFLGAEIASAAPGGALSHTRTLWLRLLRAALGSFPGDPHNWPSVAICNQLRGSPASPSTAFGCLAELAISLVKSFSVLFCRGVWNHFLLEESTETLWLSAPGTSTHNCPASGPPAVRVGGSRRRIRKHFLADFCGSLPQDSSREACGAGQEGQGLFFISFSAGNSGFICPWPF